MLKNIDKPETGDIYLVKFHPGYGTEFKKYRPAVIISDVTTNIDNRFALIAPLTTNKKIVHPQFELLIKKNAVLDKDSVLLCWYLWTIDSSRLVRKLGILDSKESQKMKKMVQNLL